ncbi:RNA polymerase sigma factor FliA [Arsenophonus sp. PmNCSU2021_1]|uniref:RNA polymerase sigma factor FliA n=1 Tax=Arsenophonus sp. PmNCSU2021_1 TaxID=3118989 RepID=UPI002FF298CF
MNDLYTQDGIIEKDVLLERYLPLVRHEALKLQVRLPASVQLDDLIQAGGIGLFDAIERFDMTQGTAFATYAVQRVRGAMLDALRARDWVPRSVRRLAREAAKVMQQLEQALGRPASEQEIADKLHIGLSEYQQLLQDSNNSQLCSYDEWHEVHGESCELIIEVDDERNPLQTLIATDIRKNIIKAIECLPEREKMVLTLYYQEDLNLKEIGAVLNVGESRVSQLHSQAIKRLRARLNPDK